MAMIKEKKNEEFGIQGYRIPKYNAYFDKPLGRKWIEGNIPSFWDTLK